MALVVLLVSAELFFPLPTPEELSGLPPPQLWAEPPRPCPNALTSLSSLSPSGAGTF